MNRSLLELEWSRYRSALPGWKGDALGRLALYGTPMAGGFFGLLAQKPDASMTYAFAVAVLFGLVVLSILLFMLENMRRTDPNQQWWLMLPYERYTLAKARFQGYCGLGYVVLSLSALFAMIGYGAAAAWLGIEGDAPSMAAMLAIAGIGITGIPVIAAWGALISIFARSRWYWVLLYLLYLLATFGVGPSLLGILFAAEIADSRQWLTLDTLAGIQLGMIVIGWPLAYGVLKLTARIGLPNLADPRNMPNAAARQSDRKDEGYGRTGRRRRDDAQAEAAVQAPVSAFRALCVVERRRLGLIADRLISRILWGISVVGLAVGGYYAYGYSESIVMAPSLLGGAVTYMLVLYLPITIGQDIQAKKLEWWLSLPQSRMKMLLAKMAVHLRIAVGYIVSLFGSFWLGLLVRVASDEAATLQGLAKDAEWLAYELLLGCVMFIVTMSYFLGSTIFNNAYPKSSAPVALLIFIPVIFRNRIIDYYFAEFDRMAEVAPYWDRLLWTLIIGGLFSMICIGVGARLLNRLAKVKPKQGGWLFGSQKREA